MNAAEHFAWAKARAMEYVEMGDGGTALSSLISDLRKHEGTAGILHQDLLMLATQDYMLGGLKAARAFIEGLAGPVVTPS